MLTADENTTGTVGQEPKRAGDYARNDDPTGRRQRRCSYVAAECWHYGAGDPFCPAPALPDSSYCAEHKALCRLAPGSAAADRAAAALQRAAEAAQGPPAELGFLDLPAIPDLDGEVDPDDIAHCIDLPDLEDGDA